MASGFIFARAGGPLTQSQPGCLPEQVRACDIGEIIGLWRRKFCRANAFFREREPDQIGEPFVDGDDFISCARQRPQQQQVV